MKNLKTFEDYSDLDKQDKERAERNQISNFPHSAKEEAKKREKIEKRSHKEDPDGMYPRDDKRYDYSNDSRGGWQDGMGKPSWLGESFEDEDLILSLMKDKGWGDLSYNRIEDFKNSGYYKDPIDENEFVEQFDDYLYSQEISESVAEDYLKRFNENKETFTVLYEVEDYEADLHLDNTFDFEPVETGYSDGDMVTMKAKVFANSQEEADKHVLSRYETAILR
jgi:hypothetical protein